MEAGFADKVVKLKIDKPVASSSGSKVVEEGFPRAQLSKEFLARFGGDISQDGFRHLTIHFH